MEEEGPVMPNTTMAAVQRGDTFRTAWRGAIRLAKVEDVHRHGRFVRLYLKIERERTSRDYYPDEPVLVMTRPDDGR